MLLKDRQRFPRRAIFGQHARDLALQRGLERPQSLLGCGLLRSRSRNFRFLGTPLQRDTELTHHAGAGIAVAVVTVSRVCCVSVRAWNVAYRAANTPFTRATSSSSALRRRC